MLFVTWILRWCTHSQTKNRSIPSFIWFQEVLHSCFLSTIRGHFFSWIYSTHLERRSRFLISYMSMLNQQWYHSSQPHSYNLTSSLFHDISRKCGRIMSLWMAAPLARTCYQVELVLFACSSLNDVSRCPRINLIMSL